MLELWIKNILETPSSFVQQKLQRNYTQGSSVNPKKKSRQVNPKKTSYYKDEI